MAIESALKERYEQEIIPNLMERFHYKNRMQVPKVVKIVVNMGVGEAVSNSRAMEQAVGSESLDRLLS